MNDFKNASMSKGKGGGGGGGGGKMELHVDITVPLLGFSTSFLHLQYVSPLALL